MSKAVRLLIGLVVVIISFTYLIVYALPNLQKAQENVDQAQIEYDQSLQDLDDSFRTCLESFTNEECLAECNSPGTDPQICKESFERVTAD